MKSNIFIHIGLHKTGSTSIQATLFRNREKLLAHGIDYLAIGQNHSNVLVPLLIDNPHNFGGFRRAGIDSKEKAARKNAETMDALQRALADNSSESLVVSGEELSALGLAGTERLRDLFAPYARCLRIVAYIRDPYATINSIVQQRMNRGETYEEIIAQPPRPRYARLGPAVTVFGRDNVDIRLFDPARFAGGDLIADFLAAVGAPPSLAGELASVRANVSLSLEAAVLMNEINKRQPAGAAWRNRDLARWLSAVPGQPYRCPPEVIEAAAPLIARDLRWLHDLLGKNVFADHPPSDWTVAPRWNDETLGAIAVLINTVALESERARKTKRSPLGILRAMLGAASKTKP